MNVFISKIFRMRLFVCHYFNRCSLLAIAFIQLCLQVSFAFVNLCTAITCSCACVDICGQDNVASSFKLIIIDPQCHRLLAVSCYFVVFLSFCRMRLKVCRTVFRYNSTFSIFILCFNAFFMST